MSFEVKGSSFLENVMIAAAYSKIDSEESQLNSLKMRVYRILDAILIRISSCYRERRAEFCYKVMKAHANKNIEFEKVTEVAQKKLETKKTPQIKQSEQNDDFPEFLRNMDTSALSKSQFKIEKRAKAYKADQLEAEQLAKADDLPSLLRNIDINALYENTPEREEAAESYEQLQFQKNLMNNPGALAAFLTCLQMYAANKNSTDFPEELRNLEVEKLYESSPEMEKALQEHQIKVDQKEFNEKLPDNLAAMAGFLWYLQACAAKKRQEAKKEQVAEKDDGKGVEIEEEQVLEME